MKHSIRERIIDPIRGKIVKVSTINSELGSGITDKNGKEIFEGDILTNGRDKFPVEFHNGALLIFNAKAGEGWDINPHFAQGFEIIGHVED